MLDKVRDHDHITGRFRGAAHEHCNLRAMKQVKIPVFLHKFRGYDSHLITLSLNKFADKEIQIIGQGMEKYLTMGWGDHIVFKDSFQFMASALATLTANLLKAGKANFELIRTEFVGISDADFDLLLRKGVYPYDYTSSWERLAEHQLPAREEFFSKLRQEECSAADYQHAQTVWGRFNCQSLQEYMELYLNCNVLQLACVFEQFRDVCLRHYELDPSYYVSSPNLAWDSMLKLTGVVLDLISDPEIFKMLDCGIRGGICMISKRHALANNNRVPGFDPTKPTSHIVYYDANNLYGWAMAQPIADYNIRWIGEEVYSKIDWQTQTETQETGYFVECDLDYPQELHNAHNEYPLAPERLNICVDMISETQKKIVTCYNIPRTSLNQTKLVPNLMAKKKYAVHYLNLKFYLDHGLKLTKIHRVIAFHQSPWLSQYINLNQQLRAKGTNDFEKDFFKLMNNSVYGKTCENMKKRTDIKLVTNDNKRRLLTNKPHCLSYRIFGENLAGIQLRKVKVLINKPFYVGFTVLELSKLLMYRFHNDYIKPRYQERAQLLFTDTDSLMYEIETADIYKDMWADRDLFDFASYPLESPYFDATINKVVGNMKDEALLYQFVNSSGYVQRCTAF